VPGDIGSSVIGVELLLGPCIFDIVVGGDL
jgi:hypothetical protein